MTDTNSPLWQAQNETPLEVATFHAYDQSTVELYTQAPALYSLVWDLKQDLRNYLKHGHSFKTVEEALDFMYDRLCESFKE